MMLSTISCDFVIFILVIAWSIHALKSDNEC